MARSRNKDDKTRDMFKKKKKGSSGHGEKETDLTPKQIEKSIPKGPVVKDKMYGGLDIGELVDVFEGIAEKYGAELIKIRWLAKTEIRLNDDVDHVIPVLDEIIGLSKQYGFNISASIRVFSGDGEINSTVVISLPGLVEEIVIA